MVAAIMLIALKLGAGLASHSLGLISEALHSGTDLVAALLTLFAVGVAVRPADVSHQYGHGKAEHLSALAEAAILVAASGFIAWRAITHRRRSTDLGDATWYAFVVIAIVIAVDLSRTVAPAGVTPLPQRGAGLECTPLRQRPAGSVAVDRPVLVHQAIHAQTPQQRSSSLSSSARGRPPDEAERRR